MTANQEHTLAAIERRLGMTRRDSERFAAERIPAYETAHGELDAMTADHLILILSDRACRHAGGPPN